MGSIIMSMMNATLVHTDTEGLAHFITTAITGGCTRPCYPRDDDSEDDDRRDRDA